MSENSQLGPLPYIAVLGLGCFAAWVTHLPPSAPRAMEPAAVLPAASESPRLLVAAAPLPDQPAPGPQRSLKILVDQVLPGGIIARPYETHAIASALTRAGGGGNVATGYHRGRKSIFLTGLTGAAEGQTTDVLAYPQGTAEAQPGRTLERWVYVRPAQL